MHIVFIWLAVGNVCAIAIWVKKLKFLKKGRKREIFVFSLPNGI